MTLTIDFAPEEEARLRERATAVGKDIGTFIREAALEKAEGLPLAELLTPIHTAIAESGITIEEIDAMADRARDEVRSQRRASRTQSPP